MNLYVLLSSIVEMLNAACGIIIILDDMKPPDRVEMRKLEKFLLDMIQYSLDMYEQALKYSEQLEHKE